jgi:hypothetical protein
VSRQATTSQTVGPFFSIGLTRMKHDDLVSVGTSGERVIIEGRASGRSTGQAGGTRLFRLRAHPD